MIQRGRVNRGTQGGGSGFTFLVAVCGSQLHPCSCMFWIEPTTVTELPVNGLCGRGLKFSYRNEHDLLQHSYTTSGLTVNKIYSVD